MNKKTTFLIITLFIIVILSVYQQYGKTYFEDVATFSGVTEPSETFIISSFEIGGLPSQELIRFGSAWGDIDQDGCTDLFVANPAGMDKLYKNNCDGTFSDIAKEVGVAFGGKSTGAAFGDIDNDRCLDLYITVYEGENRLYKNDCAGNFTEISETSGVEGDDKYRTASVAWADYNNDGFLDIFVTNLYEEDIEYKKMNEEDTMEKRVGQQAFARAVNNDLYKNNGNGTFTEISSQAGLSGSSVDVFYFEKIMNMDMSYSGVSYGSGFFDYNRDRCIDVLVFNDAGPSPLYRNNCDGTFSDVTQEMGIEKFMWGMGVAFSDLNGDKIQDIFITNGVSDTLFVSSADDGKFNDDSISIGVYQKPYGMGEADYFLMNTENEVGWGAQFFDYDNDGDKDIFVANGSYYFDDVKSNKNRFYINNGGRFTSTVNGIGNNIERSSGVSYSDYDNDGDIDLYITNTEGKNSLLKNIQDKGNNWITISLNGKKSNSLGIGAEVEVFYDDKSEVSQMVGGSGYLTQSDYILHFGLRKTDAINKITVRWPSGVVDELENVSVNKKITITEGKTSSN